jgi:hypothetical protein
LTSNRTSVRLTLNRLFVSIASLFAHLDRHEGEAKRSSGNVLALATMFFRDFSVFPNNAAASNRQFSDTTEFHALENVEVAGVHVVLGGDFANRVRIPNDDIGVGARTKTTLLRIATEKFCDFGGNDLNEAARCHQTSADTVVPNNRHAILKAVDTVGDFAEVIFAKSLLVGVEGAVVSADSVEIAVGEVLHQDCLGFGVRAERRAHDVGSGVAPAVMPASTSVSSETSGDWLTIGEFSFVASADDSFTCQLAHDVNNVNGSVDARANHESAISGFGFDFFGAAHGVSFGAGDALLDDAFRAFLDGVAVFGVDLNHGADSLASLEDFEHFSICYHEDALVRHETLEGGDTVLLDEGFHFLGDVSFLIPPCDGAVETVVANDLGVGPRAPLVPRSDERLALGRNGEVDEHCGTTSDGGASAVIEVIDGDLTHEGKLAVRVGIDSSRHHKSVFAVDHTCASRTRLDVDSRLNLGDFVSDNEDIRNDFFFSGNTFTTLEENCSWLLRHFFFFFFK